MSSRLPPRGRRALVAAAAVAVAFVALCVPVRTPSPPDVRPTPFRWDADSLFAALEAEFERALGADPVAAEAALDTLEAEADALLVTLPGTPAPDRATLERVATLQFEIAVQAAAHPPLMPRLDAILLRARSALMDAATAWPATGATHEALYRVLLGGRIALDEALVQAGLESLPAIRTLDDVPSETPSIEVQGVRVHSGDILLSRGGAPTSALIARGNDFPNPFSHVALAHVDSETGVGTVVESLIEAGSVLSTVDEYLASKKHRILVLRLRPDHPAVVDDPLVAHRAAEAMLTRVRAGHIPYDFAMDWRDPSRAFCSEIVYHAYESVGVDLWPLRSSFSSPGLLRWLWQMGVREATSLVPSDAEYDPQLRAVVEWRNAPALVEYRLDNAVTDALLEEAERGASLGYAWYALPPARLLKALSTLRDVVGATPTIPEGMDAAAALRVRSLVTTVHPVLVEELEARLSVAERAHEVPYWELVGMARSALASKRSELSPALRSR